MILEALRRSVVRWFRKSDTSVPSQIPGYEIRTRVGPFGFMTANLEHIGTPWSPSPSLLDWSEPADAGLMPSPEPAPSRLGVKPAADPEIDNASWAWWETCRGTRTVPGWGYCRFANRVGDKAAFAFGYVRGSFGLWEKPFRTCTGFHPDVVSSQQMLVTATHLLTGHAVGLFENLTIAAEACELADRVASEWGTASETAGLDPAIHRTQQAWAGAGIVPSSTSHAHHDDDGLPELILTRSIKSVMEGKPERLS